MPITLVSDGHFYIGKDFLRDGRPPCRVEINGWIERDAGATSATGSHDVNVTIAVIIHAFKDYPQTIWREFHIFYGTWKIQPCGILCFTVFILDAHQPWA